MVKVKAEFDDTEFATIKMTYMVYEAYINYLDCKTDSNISPPEKFSYKNDMFVRRK